MAKNMLQKQDAAYSNLLADIRSVYVGGQTKAVQMARRQMLVTYWHIGRHIVEFEQIGEERALYGIKLIERLSTDLSHQFDKEIWSQ